MYPILSYITGKLRKLNFQNKCHWYPLSHGNVRSCWDERNACRHLGVHPVQKHIFYMAIEMNWRVNFFRICFLCSSFKLDKGVLASDYSFLCIVRRPCLSSFAAVCRSQAGQNKGTSVLLEQVYPDWFVDGSACPSRLRLFNILTHEYFKGPECTIEGCWHDMEETYVLLREMH